MNIAFEETKRIVTLEQKVTLMQKKINYLETILLGNNYNYNGNVINLDNNLDNNIDTIVNIDNNIDTIVNLDNNIDTIVNIDDTIFRSIPKIPYIKRMNGFNFSDIV